MLAREHEGYGPPFALDADLDPRVSMIDDLRARLDAKKDRSSTEH
jgi:hypothetical protein